MKDFTAVVFLKHFYLSFSGISAASWQPGLDGQLRDRDHRGGGRGGGGGEEGEGEWGGGPFPGAEGVQDQGAGGEWEGLCHRSGPVCPIHEIHEVGNFS